MFLFVCHDKSSGNKIIAFGGYFALFIIVFDDIDFYFVISSRTISIYKTTIYSLLAFLVIGNSFWSTVGGSFLGGKSVFASFDLGVYYIFR